MLSDDTWKREGEAEFGEVKDIGEGFLITFFKRKQFCELSVEDTGYQSWKGRSWECEEHKAD